MMSYYDSLINYDKIYIFPSDLKNDFEGLKVKLSEYQSMKQYGEQYIKYREQGYEFNTYSSIFIV